MWRGGERESEKQKKRKKRRRREKEKKCVKRGQMKKNLDRIWVSFDSCFDLFSYGSDVYRVGS
jgi:hypothetical protein